MKINSISNILSVEEVEISQVFAYAGALYMKVKRTISPVSKWHVAVNLKTGILVSISSETIVTLKSNAILVTEGENNI